MKFKFIVMTLLCALIISLSACNSESGSKYLAKPTGQYNIGYEDFYWINQKKCPDFNFNGKNKEDFSPENSKYCHEIIARIYYPTESKGDGSLYYDPIIRDSLGQLIPFASDIKKQLLDFQKTRSYATEKSAVILDKKFPVILFHPGFGCSAELYENFITNLVSHGYIVVGINTPFINPAALSNKSIVRAAFINSQEKAVKLYYPLQQEDSNYVLEKIKILHNTNSIFSAMDLQHIGAFGHSVGAKTVADAAHFDSKKFQAIVTLDLCGGDTDPKNAAHKKFNIPAMHLIAADNATRAPNLHINFELGNNNYLVGIAPNMRNHDYSLHMNFSDNSTLQYAPAFVGYTNYFKTHPDNPWLGNGDGWEITKSINTYLLKFFDSYLKDEKNTELTQCKILSKNTYIKCGKLGRIIKVKI